MDIFKKVFLKPKTKPKTKPNIKVTPKTKPKTKPKKKMFKWNYNGSSYEGTIKEIIDVSAKYPNSPKIYVVLVMYKNAKKVIQNTKWINGVYKQ